MHGMTDAERFVQAVAQGAIVALSEDVWQGMLDAGWTDEREEGPLSDPATLAAALRAAAEMIEGGEAEVRDGPAR